MTRPVSAHLELSDFRRRVAALYLGEPREGEEGLEAFRRGREKLWLEHPASSLTSEQRRRFGGLPWFPYDPAARVTVGLQPAATDDEGLVVETGGDDGVIEYRRVGRLETGFGALTLFWMTGYGGGLFLPMRDATSGAETYGGGRYLTDTVKGTHGRGLEWPAAGDELILDFNYAYNPSCAYNAHWACPLAPAENRLEAAVRAGELAYPDPM